ncbi:MAG: FAD-dependent oxidoreductase, partial [Planctomycetales bacterium]
MRNPFASLMFTSSLTFTFTALLLVGTSPAAEEREYDVVIYGGTSAGAAAAVQAARMGNTVVVIEPGEHLGGLSSGGLGWTDSGNKTVIGGVSREFYQRVKKHYDQPSAWKHQKPESYSRYRPGDDAMWTFAPSVAERIFEDWMKEHRVPVFRNQRLNRKSGVKKEQGRIVSIATENGDVYRGKMFIDATYEGDLLAAAGVSFTVG